MELDIAFLARAVGNTTAERHFIVAANARRSAIGAILWNDGMGQWLDYWLPVDTPEKAFINGQKVIMLLCIDGSLVTPNGCCRCSPRLNFSML